MSKQNKPVSSMQRILPFAKPYRITFLLVTGCMVLAILGDLLQPYLVKIAIDSDLINGKNSFRILLYICGIYLLLSLVSLVFTYLQNILLQYAGQSIVSDIRKKLFKHITKMSMSFFDSFPSGSLITHVSSDTESINQFFTQVCLSALRDGMTLIFIMILMFKLDATLALYSMILLPIIAFIAFAFRSYMRKTYEIARTNLSRMIAFVAENLAGMNLIQAFHQEKEQQKRFLEQNRTYLHSNIREIKVNVLFNRSFDILGNISVAFITWVGGMAMFHHHLEFGVLYAFITYIRQFFQPINAITQQWNTLQSATVSMDRINKIFAIEPGIDEPITPTPIDLPAVKGRIDYNQVEFGYKDDVQVIRGINLHIHPGEMVGIVGVTGAGKSSLISLLCRFYDVKQGNIQIDGIDVRKISQPTLQKMIGLVQQEPYLYSGSICDNVRLFDESISRDEVIQACRFVGAEAMIEQMPDGYDTRLSERGSGLSAGERQLISFARIIVFQPKILILDEATANLDSLTEQLVQRALGLVSKGRTTLVIAHRLSTVMQADRIIVMRQGQIVEQGNHQHLLELHGYYEQLYIHSQGGSSRDSSIA